MERTNFSFTKSVQPKQSSVDDVPKVETLSDAKGQVLEAVNESQLPGSEQAPSSNSSEDV